MWIIWWFLLFISFIFVMILRRIFRKSKIIIVLSDWFKRHLNLTWLSFYILTLVVACSYVVYIVQQPPPTTMVATPNHYDISGQWIEGTSTYIIDDKALEARNSDVAILWFWPIYLIGTILISRWVLNQKNRSLHWLWLTLFFLAITPILLSKKEANVLLENEVLN